MGGHPDGGPCWQSLAAYSIGPTNAPLSFPARLARENRWSEDYSQRVIGEYKRFCLLACSGIGEVTPSDAVDQAWHLHLTYTRDYWERFCPEVLGKPLHHGPTTGTSGDRMRFYEQYAGTLKAYEEMFGEAPPADIWPSARRRFNDDPRGVRVNPADALILSRKAAYIAAMAALLLLALLVWRVIA